MQISQPATDIIADSSNGYALVIVMEGNFNTHTGETTTFATQYQVRHQGDVVWSRDAKIDLEADQAAWRSCSTYFNRASS